MKGRSMPLVLLLAALIAFARPVGGQELPLFDAHLHYNDQAQEPYPLAHVQGEWRHRHPRQQPPQ
jgi:hypothetical protein